MNHDEEAALELIRQARRSGGKSLTEAETKEFITRKINLGFPQIPEYKGRGRRPTRTQYDDALDRRRDIYRLLVKLPRARVKAASKRIEAGGPLREIVLRIASRFNGPKRVRNVMAYFAAHSHLPQPDESTVKRILRRADLIGRIKSR